MSKRVTLSIPDTLYRKLEEWRDSFNLSRVFQDALAEMIRRKENLVEHLQADLPQIIDRLKKEKKETESSWEHLGREKGMQWARGAHWLDLKKMLSRDVESLIGNSTDFPAPFRKVLDQEAADAASADREEFFRSFTGGWFKGVRDFWALVEDKL